MITKVITWLDTWSRKLPQPQASDPDQPIASQPQISVTAQTAMPPLAQLKVTKVETPTIVTLSKATVPFLIANPWVDLPAATGQNDLSVKQSEQLEGSIANTSAIQDCSPSSCETPDPESAIAKLEIPEIPSKLGPQPLLDRAALVIALLDEAYSQGIEGYATLIAYVKQQSGTGCSRRTIAEWKKLRGLIPEQSSGEQAA